MIVWKGKGILTVLVLITIILLFSLILPEDFEDFSFVFGCFGAGFFSWYFGRKWNHEHGRFMINKETGREIELKQNHTLFWIKMQYWGIILTVIGLVILVKALS